MAFIGDNIVATLEIKGGKKSPQYQQHSQAPNEIQGYSLMKFRRTFTPR